MGDVEELGAHEPSVESVITRLYRNMSEIEHITAIITWDNKEIQVVGSRKTVLQASLEQAVHLADVLEGVKEVYFKDA